MTRSPRLAVAAFLAIAAVTASGCTASPPTQPLPTALTSEARPTQDASETGEGWWRPSAAPSMLALGLVAPWSVVPLNGGALVSERGDGTVREITRDGSLREVGRVPGVVSGGESGSHGLALWTDGGGGQWLYAYFGAAEDNRVVRMPLTGTSGSLALGEPEEILTGVRRANVHNGGRIAFGPDGMLYIATGDAGDSSASQDPDSLNGKILRVTPDGAAAPGNPFGTRVYTLGHRNVQGLAWTSDGVMWASEFGQNTWDELNRIDAGANYGWPLYEGTAGAAGFADPIVTWRTDEASPSGIAAVGDTVFVASLRGARLWVVDTEDGGLRGEAIAVLVGEQGRLRDVVAAPDGTLWILTNNTDGRGAARPGDDVLLSLPVQRGG